MEVHVIWKWNRNNETTTFFHLNCDCRSRTMTNGTNETERLELIVRRQNGILRAPPFHCLRHSYCLFPAPFRRNLPLLEQLQPQAPTLTIEQLGAEPNLLRKKEEINVKPNSSSFLP